MLIAIIPAAGLGTRAQQLTKGKSKEMVYFNGIPLIEHAINEAKLSSIRNITVVSHIDKEDLNNYLETQDVNVVFQKERKGLADSILTGYVKSEHKNASVAVILPDEIYPNICALKQLLSLRKGTDSGVIGVSRVPRKDVTHYGCVKVEDGKLADILEKSTNKDLIFDSLVANGRYILPNAFLEDIKKNLVKSPTPETVFNDTLKTYKDFCVKEIISRRIDFGRGGIIY